MSFNENLLPNSANIGHRNSVYRAVWTCVPSYFVSLISFYNIPLPIQNLLCLSCVCTQILRVGNNEERSDHKMCSRAQVSPWKSHSILKMLSLLPSREQQGTLLSEGLRLPDIYLEGHRTKQFWEKLLWDLYVLCRQSKCNDCKARIGPKRFLSKIWAVPTAIWYWGTNRKGMFTTFMNESIKNAMHKNVWSQFHGETWKLVQGIQFPVLVP